MIDMCFNPGQVVSNTPRFCCRYVLLKFLFCFVELMKCFLQLNSATIFCFRYISPWLVVHLTMDTMLLTRAFGKTDHDLGQTEVSGAQM